MVKFTQTGFIIFLFSILGQIGCVKVFFNNVKENKNEQENLVKNMKIEAFSASLSNKFNTEWKISKLNSRRSENPEKYFFITKKIFWSFGENIYKTSDGGETWKYVDIDKPSNTLISKIYFADENKGWAIIQQREEDYSEFGKNHFWLLVTNDGGESWKEQLDSSATIISNIGFSDTNVGWIVGNKYLMTGIVKSSLYVIITKDGGKSWKDVSIDLNQIANDIKQTGNRSINAIVVKNEKISLLMEDYWLFQSDNLGDSWKLVDNLPDDNPVDPIKIKRMGINQDGAIWFVGGSYHYTPLSGIIRESKGNWEKYTLENTYFSDGIFLSNDQVIACGLKREKKQLSSAVILFSTDRGKSWSPIFQDEKIEYFEFLQKIDESIIIVLDAKGAIYMLERV
jgi:photosystem II stability/assembly factor-like uncharacterized protein